MSDDGYLVTDKDLTEDGSDDRYLTIYKDSTKDWSDESPTATADAMEGGIVCLFLAWLCPHFYVFWL